MSNNLIKEVDEFVVKNIEVVKTARYYCSGNENSENIWFLLHGYGMTAKSMLKIVTECCKGDILFIAPEGLSRFYRSGFSGPIVASWMTKEDRENEIKDYVGYLEKLNDIVNPTNKSINILGFSQGVATASRWIYNSKSDFKKIILWAGEPALDIDYRSVKSKIETLNFVCGNKDQFLNQTQIGAIKDCFTKAEINFTIETFDGQHELNMELLSKLI